MFCRLNARQSAILIGRWDQMGRVRANVIAYVCVVNFWFLQSPPKTISSIDFNVFAFWKILQAIQRHFNCCAGCRCNWIFMQINFQQSNVSPFAIPDGRNHEMKIAFLHIDCVIIIVTPATESWSFPLLLCGCCCFLFPTLCIGMNERGHTRWNWNSSVVSLIDFLSGIFNWTTMTPTKHHHHCQLQQSTWMYSKL